LNVIPTPIPPIKPGSTSTSKRKRAVSIKSESGDEDSAGGESDQEGGDDIKEQDNDATIGSVGKGKKPEKKGKSRGFEQQMLSAMKELSVSLPFEPGRQTSERCLVWTDE
jgi:hypothetical protein